MSDDLDIVSAEFPAPPVKPNGAGSTIFIAGPMSNRPNFNRDAFGRAVEGLQRAGWSTFSPVARDMNLYGVDMFINPTGDIKVAVAEHGFDLRHAMGDNAYCICRIADAIYMLDGWRNSNGATVEGALAKLLDLPIHYQNG